jgi:hypothetical protein
LLLPLVLPFHEAAAAWVPAFQPAPRQTVETGKGAHVQEEDETG